MPGMKRGMKKGRLPATLFISMVRMCNRDYLRLVFLP